MDGYGIIYKATSPSGKVYIGQTIHSLRFRKGKHSGKANCKKSNTYNTKFYKAIRKYGTNQFCWEVIYSDIIIEKLNKLEIKTIREYNSFNRGYNSTEGGVGCRHAMSEQNKKKMSALHLGKIIPQFVRDKISESLRGEKNPFFW